MTMNMQFRVCLLSPILWSPLNEPLTILDIPQAYTHRHTHTQLWTQYAFGKTGTDKISLIKPIESYTHYPDYDFFN